jgi:uncharacterized protein (DUF58 family)
VKFIYKPFFWGQRAAGGMWYWARRRFTAPGLAAAGMVLVTASVGVDIENTVAYQSFASLLALLLFAVGSGSFFRAVFTIERRLPRLGTVGQPLRYPVRVHNPAATPQASLTLMEDLADPRPAFDEWLAFQMAESRRLRAFRFAGRQSRNPFRRAESKPVEIPPLPPRGAAEAAMEILPLRRGVLHFEGASIARPDPLGLYRALARLTAPQSVLILPKRYALPSIALPGTVRYEEGGVALAAHVGNSEEFVSLRDYRHGDPVRHIHWRSWAKTGRPIVKEFEDEFFVRHALVLDTFNDEPHSELFEEAVSVAASFACTVLTQESLLDLLFVGNQTYCFTAGRGLAHADQMLEILASVKNCADKPFDTLEHLVLNHVASVSGCICVLQRWDAARRRLVDRLRALGVPLLVLLVVPAGDRLAGEGSPLSDATGTVHVLETGKIQEALSRLK